MLKQHEPSRESVDGYFERKGRVPCKAWNWVGCLYSGIRSILCLLPVYPARARYIEYRTEDVDTKSGDRIGAMQNHSRQTVSGSHTLDTQ